MPKTRIRVPMMDFTGGLNEDDQPGALQANELRIANHVYWRGRALSSRPGTGLVATAGTAPGVGLWQLVRDEGTVLDYIGVFGNKLYKAATSATPIDITGAVTITASQNNLVTFTHFNDIALMCNGVNAPWKWTGTGDATVLGGSPPEFLTMVAKWNRVFGAGNSSAPRTIRFTALGDPESWPAANTVAAILGDSSSAISGADFIWQLGHLGDSLFVGLANSIGRVLYTGDATTPFRYNQIASFGIDGAHNYVAVGTGGYFLTNRGVHFIRPSDIQVTYDSSLVSGRRLRKTWGNLDKNRLKYVSGVLYQTRQGNLLVVWSLTTAGHTTNDLLLIMDVTDGPGSERFALWPNYGGTALGTGRNGATQQEELFGLYGFQVWQIDNGNTADGDDGGWVSEAATRWEDFGVPSEKKNFRDLYIEAQQGIDYQLGIDVYFDYLTPVSQLLYPTSPDIAVYTIWGSGTWGTGTWSTATITREYLLGVDDGVVMSFRFHTDEANQPWSLYKVVPSVESIGEARERP